MSGPHTVTFPDGRVQSVSGRIAALVTATGHAGSLELEYDPTTPEAVLVGATDDGLEYVIHAGPAQGAP